MEYDCTVTQVGFIMTDDERFGCSPDGMILGDVCPNCNGEPTGLPCITCGGLKRWPVNGALELKCPTGKVHVGYLRGGVLPSEYRPQVHGELLITCAPWVDFMSYCPGLPPFVTRVTPDDFTIALRDAMELFWSKYQAALRPFLEV